MADGWITIGTKLSTDEFDSQVAKLEAQIKKTEQKAEIKIDVKSNLQKEIQAYDKILDNIAKRINEIAPKVEEYYSAEKRIDKDPQHASVKDYQIAFGNESFVKAYEKLTQEFQEALNKQAKLKEQVQKTDIEYAEINEKVAEYKRKIESINIKKQNKEVQKINDGFKNVNSTIQKTAKRAGGLALAIFGIRSAYLALRRASSELAIYDQQYATNLEYIRFALVQVIAPVLRYIVNLVAKLLSLLNAVMNAWFGINLFTSGSAENFRKMKASAGGISKAVKEIKKQLTGFDEINMLTSQSDTGTSSGIGTPNFDLSEITESSGKLAEKLKKYKGIILGFFAGLVTFLLLTRFGVEALKALGIGIMIWGIVDAITSLLDYLKSPTWNNFGGTIEGIAIAILGLSLITKNWQIALIGAILLIVSVLIRNWEKIQAGIKKAVDWISSLGDNLWKKFNDNIDKLESKFGKFGTFVISIFVGVFDWISKAVSGMLDMIYQLFTGYSLGIRNIFDGIINIFKGNFKEGIISIAKGILNLLIGKINMFVSGANALFYPIRNLIVALGALNGKSWTLETIRIPHIPYVKTGALINMPNKGTLVGGSALGGESGREGVIPLTDQQAMAELGREIGKNVLVNLTNITTMNGRVIGRELKQINSEQNFAYNM